MKKSVSQFSLNLYSKVGKSWTLDSNSKTNNDLPENFILGMTNNNIESD
ncbi:MULTISPECIES: hypothetical protein [Arenibacter]|jgi:hypothetical protein|nr:MULTISPECIES: hypothetical protein [Arenibacter]